tara:strand:+ start:104 stop:295 length:192 start_codon:yes stop_codon:yes gene_type:complete
MNKPLIIIEKIEGQQAPNIKFETDFNSLERVDQVELLVTVEKEVAAHRRSVCNEMFQYSKGRW